jgi:hypothetical protein
MKNVEKNIAQPGKIGRKRTQTTFGRPSFAKMILRYAVLSHSN